MYDLIIKNGLLVDGSGLPAYTADVAIADGRVARIGRIEDNAERALYFGRAALTTVETLGWSPDRTPTFQPISRSSSTASADPGRNGSPIAAAATTRPSQAISTGVRPSSA